MWCAVASGEGVLADEATEQWFPGDDLFAQLRPKGLPIGNLTSQFFANVLLDSVDHFVKEELRVKGYVRYADDLVLFGNSKPELRELLAELERFFASIRLTLHRHKTHVAPSSSGVRYLGFQLFREGRRLTRESIRRFNRRLRRFQAAWRESQIDSSKIRLSLRAWLSHTSLANSRGIRRALIKRYKFQRSASRAPSSLQL